MQNKKGFVASGGHRFQRFFYVTDALNMAALGKVCAHLSLLLTVAVHSATEPKRNCKYRIHVYWKSDIFLCGIITFNIWNYIRLSHIQI